MKKPTRPAKTADLRLAGVPVLLGLPPQVHVERAGDGAFLSLRFDKPGSRRHQILGRPARVSRFTACHRAREPFWMQPCAGTRIAQVPAETQSLFIERDDGRIVLVVPLVEAPARCALRGLDDDALEVACDTGDAFLSVAGCLAAYVAVGDCPYALAAAAAEAVAARLGSGRLRRDKPVPDIADRFGWCTWDAFYQDVSAEKVLDGLKGFAEAGVSPRLLILDDGWQQERTCASGERRLTGFGANQRFPVGLAALVQAVKAQHGIERFLVWHAVGGYWGGVDGAALPGYGVHDQVKRYALPILLNPPRNEDWMADHWGNVSGLVPPEHIHRFYQDYHRAIAAAGVDGVKIDNQASLEALGDGVGGRVRLMAAYREALESSVNQHLGGRLINCMSCSNDMLYHARTTNLVRTSTDFWPNRPESHGLHLHTNAQVCQWFGEFVHGDWDMFQSSHSAGAFHAAGRAVSGAPIYVSDKPRTHDAALLHKLVCSDGRVLRCRRPGRPTRDCLFRDPTREEVLLKIWNENHEGWVVGAFNARHDSPGATAGTVGPVDLPGLPDGDYAVYLHRAGTVVILPRDGQIDLSLAALEWEIATIMPVRDGVFAAIGLTGKLNSGGAIAALTARGADGWDIGLADGGEFICWTAKAPAAVGSTAGKTVAKRDPASGLTRIRLRHDGPQTVSIAW